VPSQWHENNPRVIQESFASKTPVIASDVGGIAEFVKHGVNGLLFRRDQTDDLKQMIQQVVEDPSIIVQMQAGIQFPRTSADEMEDILAVYNSLLPVDKGEISL
jgi:glycosyltransferase involved in cell wall biosynthesis